MPNLITWDIDNNLLDLSGLDTSLQDKLTVPVPSQQTFRLGFYRGSSGDTRRYIDMGADPSIEFLIKPATGNNRFDVTPVVASPTFTRLAVDDLGDYYYEGSIEFASPKFIKALGINSGFIRESITIECVANTAKRLDGLYIDIYTSASAFYRFWFETTATTVSAPSAGGGTLYKINVANNATADDVATALFNAIDSVIDTNALTVLTDTVSAEFAAYGAMGEHNPNSTGFTVTLVTCGSIPNATTDVTSASYNGQLVYLDSTAPQISPLFTLEVVNSLYRDGQNFPSGTASSYFVVKSADQTRASTTTVADDSELVIALKAGTYQLDANIVFSNDTGGTTPGEKFKFTYSGTATVASGNLIYGNNGGNPSLSSYPNSTDANFLAPTISDTHRNYGISAGGILIVTTDGNLSFQWAQQTSSTTVSRVKAGSYVRLYKLA